MHVPGAEHNSQHGHRAALALVCPSPEEAPLTRSFDQHIAFLPHTELQVNSPVAWPRPSPAPHFAHCPVFSRGPLLSYFSSLQ